MTLYTTITKLLETKRYFAGNPNGRVKVDWCTSWNKYQFDAWFMRCLHAKINRQDARTWRKLDPDYQDALTGDGRKIHDYTMRRIRHSGCHNFLRTPEMKARFPHIDNQDRD